MPNSSEQRVRCLLGILLIAANAAMFAAWPWLRSMQLTSNTADPFFRMVNGQPRFHAAPLLRNSAYLRWYFDAVRQDRGVFMLGTSEACVRFNLADQLNHMAPDHPTVNMVAVAGGSSIHACVLFARCETQNVPLPPTILPLNLVYYMHAHDVINDGWFGNVIPSPLFLFMNDGNVRQALNQDVNALYDDHFRHLWSLYPWRVQQYLGNRLYLLFHQEPADAPRPPCFPRETFAFNGLRPKYDEDRAVAAGYVARDQMARHRWIVKNAADAVNLKGLAATMEILNRQPAPVLLLILPMNRTFYQYNGMDMAAFDAAYAEIRAQMRTFARDGRVFVADLYDVPKLDAGFLDRMHQDAYGFFQLAGHLIRKSNDYAAFLEATRRFYATDAAP